MGYIRSTGLLATHPAYSPLKRLLARVLLRPLLGVFPLLWCQTRSVSTRNGLGLKGQTTGCAAHQRLGTIYNRCPLVTFITQ